MGGQAGDDGDQTLMDDAALIRIIAILLSIVIWVCLYRLVGLFLSDD